VSGRLSVEQGDEQASMSSFALALEHHERVEQPFELGRTLLGLGIAQRRFKRKRLARESLTAASDTFDGLGAEIWSRRARDELSRISGRAGSTAGTLSETERRVAELVIQGRSNREVADALFVSVKTVEANLTRVYAKLGVSSRRELALAMSRGRPPRSRVAAAIARPSTDPLAIRRPYGRSRSGERMGGSEGARERSDGPGPGRAQVADLAAGRARSGAGGGTGGRRPLGRMTAPGTPGNGDPAVPTGTTLPAP
jgi:DNA-binding CsgD family transcriptional regulator